MSLLPVCVFISISIDRYLHGADTPIQLRRKLAVVSDGIRIAQPIAADCVRRIRFGPLERALFILVCSVGSARRKRFRCKVRQQKGATRWSQTKAELANGCDWIARADHLSLQIETASSERVIAIVRATIDTHYIRPYGPLVAASERGVAGKGELVGAERAGGRATASRMLCVDMSDLLGGPLRSAAQSRGSPLRDSSASK